VCQRSARLTQRQGSPGNKEQELTLTSKHRADPEPPLFAPDSTPSLEASSSRRDRARPNTLAEVVTSTRALLFQTHITRFDPMPSSQPHARGVTFGLGGKAASRL